MTDSEILDAIAGLLGKRTPAPTMPPVAPVVPSVSVPAVVAVPAPVAVVQPVHVAAPPVVIPGSYEDLYKYFGDPRIAGFEAKYIVTDSHEVGGKQVKMQVHRLVSPLLHSIWGEMNAAGLTKLFKTFDGSFVIRNIRGSDRPSLHSFGVALDFNASDMPLGSLKRWPDEVISIWHKYGFINGQDFHNRKDPMHFQYSKPGTI